MLVDDAANDISGAEVVLPCEALDETLTFFTARLGFRVDAIFPADDPRVAVISGHGLRLHLRRAPVGAPVTLRLLCRDPDALAGGARELVAPDGTRVELAAAAPPLDIPPLAAAYVVTRPGDDARWISGRAGMRYRDLIPDRQGGRFIASHIQIDSAGPVPDYVHFHRVRFQMIYCYRGWVRVVYEDQGPPFVLRAGDCVLQPPRIRHRVLESSAGLEVIEVSCPAEHITRADHDLPLPTPHTRPTRVFDGQRFVRHVAEDARWSPWRGHAGFEARDTGIAAATAGLAGARVIRRAPAAEARDELELAHDGELFLLFVLAGALTLRCGARAPERLDTAASVVVPPCERCQLRACTPDLELLAVALPAAS